MQRPEEMTSDEEEMDDLPLDDDDLAILKNYGVSPYEIDIKASEREIKKLLKNINALCGIKESETGLAPAHRWNFNSDIRMLHREQPLMVARCTQIINPNTDEAKYVVHTNQFGK
ncbi:26S proteasome regulatory subunit 7A-like, partial [Wolffia australiana]